MNTHVRRAIIVGFVAGALALAASPAAAEDASPPHDAWLTTKAKLAVLTNTGTAGTSVNVDTVRGTVTLHGTVASDEEKTKAEQAAKDIRGVKEVRNLLKVVPAKQAKDVAANDDKVKAAVEKSLKKESSLAASKISVQSVNDGTVLLAGKAENALAHLKAVEVVRAIPGVVTVASEIESPDARADTEIWKQIEGAGTPDTVTRDEGLTEKIGDGAKEAGSAVSDTAKATGGAIAGGAKKAGSATKDAFQGLTGSAKDAAVTTAVKAKLFADDETPGTAINVDTEDGVVTLFGTVPSSEAKKKAEQMAKDVAGVKRVRNELKVDAVNGAKSDS
ncbi:MAG: BON domain-containing protein [Candidatus Binatia bacterium]